MSIIDHILILSSTVHYSSNLEYRECIRKIFEFQPNQLSYYADLSKTEMDCEQIDAESKDEMDFDSIQMEKGMKEIFDKTKENQLFQKLYLSAAGRMFSIEMEIGQAVLCSYDTFHLYYSCIWHFFKKTRELSNCEYYQKLVSYFY